VLSADVNLRPLTADDLAQFVDELWLPFAEEMAELDSFNQLADDVDCRTEAIAHRRKRLESNQIRTIVAEDVGTLAGYVSGSCSESPSVFARGDELHISEVYVAPGYRRQGLAGELLDTLEAWGQAQGAAYAELSVNVRNEAALACYERRGYQERRLKLTREL
jgi:ribosomal protein S18 acetylase RimI-like enzyme